MRLKYTKFIIFAPFFSDFTPSDGTTIRIAGYTNGFNELGINYLFYSKLKPNYVSNEKYVKNEINQKWIKIFIIHNLLYSIILLRPLSIILRVFLNKVLNISKISAIIGERLIITHQEYTLALYLFFIFKKKFIYDIHGFFDIQTEYRKNLSLWRKIWFDIYTLQEKVVMKHAPFLNAVSLAMKNYIITTFSPKGKILIAPDGIPESLTVYETCKLNKTFRLNNNISDDDKIILYAGSLKKIGGVTELVKLYIHENEINQKAVLLLIGDGQEAENVRSLMLKSNFTNRIFRINSLSHIELLSYMKMADVIVCPDIEGNKYNEITPHIKLYDAVASGKNVVATDFKVNKALFSEKDFNLFYFSYNKIGSFKEALKQSLNVKKKQKEADLSKLTYSSRAEKYLETYFDNASLFL